MIANPCFSIVLPIYNVEQYLSECISSIQNQSNSDFEVICIEDCSTDDSLSVLKECVKDDDRFKIIQNNSNRGLSYNRNLGIKEAKGKYISFVDSDDMIASNYIETLASLFEQYDVDGIGFSNKDFVDGENIYISRKRPPSLTGVMTGPEVFHVVINESVYNVESPFYAWKRSFLLDKKLYFYDGIYHEDNLYFFKSMICCQKILMIQDELYNYRKRFGSIVNQGIKLKHIDSMLYVCDEIRKEIGSLSGSVHEDALRFLRFNESMFCYKMMKFCYDNSIADKINCKYNLDVLEDTHRFAFDYTLAMLKYVNADRYILNDKETDYIKMYKSIIIYGAGIWARRVIVGLGEKSIDDFVVAVTDNANAGKLLGNEIHQLNLLDVEHEDTIVILAAGKKYKDEMRKYAESLGFKRFLELRY